jgi:hypothetical protein
VNLAGLLQDRELFAELSNDGGGVRGRLDARERWWCRMAVARIEAAIREAQPQ